MIWRFGLQNWLAGLCHIAYPPTPNNKKLIRPVLMNVKSQEKLKYEFKTKNSKQKNFAPLQLSVKSVLLHSFIDNLYLLRLCACV